MYEGSLRHFGLGQRFGILPAFLNHTQLQAVHRHTSAVLDSIIGKLYNGVLAKSTNRKSEV